MLATSRVRLLTPYEHVCAVPGMSSSDGVALFTAHAAAAGTQVVGPRHRVAVLCRALDGMALAIELRRRPLLVARARRLGGQGSTSGCAS